MFGATLEVFIILYLGITSFVGFYAMPLFSKIRPKRRKTSLSQLIANSLLILILTSALPLLSRILGKFPNQCNKKNIIKFFIFRNNEFRLVRRFRSNRMAGKFCDRSLIQFYFHCIRRSLHHQQIHINSEKRASS